MFQAHTESGPEASTGCYLSIGTATIMVRADSAPAAMCFVRLTRPCIKRNYYGVVHALKYQ